MRANRDYAMLAMLFGCGFRRSELVDLKLDHIQMRQGHWAVVDLIGKGGHIRTVPIPEWVKAALDQWTLAAGVTEGRIFRAVARTGKVWGKRHLAECCVVCSKDVLRKSGIGAHCTSRFEALCRIPDYAESNMKHLYLALSCALRRSSRFGIAAVSYRPFRKAIRSSSGR